LPGTYLQSLRELLAPVKKTFDILNFANKCWAMTRGMMGIEVKNTATTALAEKKQLEKTD